ncbi:MAG: right-handed parallel beta-helix repeat-containing protein [Bryobacteraceae bacterium]|nr:right-handed parallel beta-helix repeat-containing protein [Bryobacteraceae bacterium]
MRRIGLLLLAARVFAGDYYVDVERGDDGNAGTSLEAPWRSLDKVNASRYEPGDRILFRAGQAWQGQLAVASSGAEGRPLVIDRYGEGARPRIEAGGIAEDAVRLYNVEWIELRNLELTNTGEGEQPRRGVHVFLDNFGAGRHIVISGLYIHDFNGTNRKKDNGGIIFRTNGNVKPSRFDGLTIERNIVWKVDRSAIAAQSYHWPRTKWFPSLNVVIRDNYVADIGGDGIVPWATDGALIEHNIARDCNRRANTYNAGIWPWSTDNSLFRFNEAAFTRTTMDGQGFDSDYNSRGTVFEYNYSHDNEGGFLLICTPGKRKAEENVGNIGTIARYNISRNDRARIFHVSAAENTLVHDNVVYVGAGLDVQLVLLSDWDGWADGLVFRGNRFYVEGKARYGYEVKREKDGTYEMAAGQGQAKNVTFEGNGFFGRHVDRPEDGSATVSEEVPATAADCNVPEFDPRHPERFDEYLAAHRAWMVRFFEAHFGRLQ